MKGVRTIALRLTGTKEAAEELEEMGEDTSDMIVSQSKMRELIMNATKVASNNYKGFDIQDELGRYKSTYEIMLGLSQIWDEIRQADLKTGDNRQNLLLESIAGKNRASIASSILQNPKTLQSVYEDSSTKSADSALKENEKVLQSITGHLARLKNAWQEMWANAANRDVINGFIDLGTKILELINDAGLLKSAFAVLFGGTIVKGLTNANSLLVKYVQLLTQSKSLSASIADLFSKLTEKKLAGWEAIKETWANRGQTGTTPTQSQTPTPAQTSQPNAYDEAINAQLAGQNAALDENTQKKLENAQAQRELTEATNEDTISSATSTEQTNADTLANAENASTSQEQVASEIEEADAKLANQVATEGLTSAEQREAETSMEAAAANGAQAESELAEATNKMASSGAEVFDILTEAMEGAGDAATGMGGALKSSVTESTGLLTLLGGKLETLKAGFLSFITSPSALLIAIPAAIFAYNKIVGDYNKHQRELIDQAHQATSAWDNTKKSVQDYASKYQDLKTQLQNTNLSEAESLDIKQQIFNLQKEITDQYGESASGIDLINGKLETQLGIIQNISQEEAKRNYTENREAYQRAIDKMNQEQSFELNTKGLSQQEFDELFKDIDYTVDLDFVTGEAKGFKFENVDTAEENLNTLNDRLLELKENMSESEWEGSKYAQVYDSLTDAISKNNDVIVENRADSRAGLETELLMTSDSTGRDLKNELKSAIDEYNKLLQFGGESDTSAIDDAQDKVKELRQEVDDFLQGDNAKFAPLFKEITDSINETAENAFNLSKEMKSDKGKTLVESAFGTYQQNRKVSKENQKAVLEASNAVLKEWKKASKDNKQIDYSSEAMMKLASAARDANMPISTIVQSLQSTGGTTALQQSMEGTTVTAEELKAALLEGNDAITGLASEFGIDFNSPETDIDAFINTMASMVGAVSESTESSGNSLDRFFKDTSAKIEQISSLSSVLQKGQSQTGLTFTKTLDEQGNQVASEVKSIIDAYKNLEGYDLGSLFEETGTGIKLNYDAYRALAQEEEAETKRQYKLQRAALENQMAVATGDEKSKIQQQIIELDMLSSAYDGATSALAKYINQQNAADYGDTYSMLQGTTIARGDELLEKGLIGTEEFRSIAQLFSFKSLATEDAQGVADAYEKGIANVRKYFTEDAVDGVLQFATDIEQLPEQFGNIARDADGAFTFDLTDQQLNNLAEHFEVSTDVIEAFFDQIRATGGEVHLWRDGGFEEFAELDKNIEDSKSKLKELKEVSNDPNLVSKLEWDISDIDTIDEMKQKITDMKDIQAKIGDPDTEAWKEAQKVIDDLESRLKKYEEAAENARNTSPVNVEDLDAANEKVNTTIDAVNKLKEAKQAGQKVSIMTDRENDVVGSAEIDNLLKEFDSMPDILRKHIVMEAGYQWEDGMTSEDLRKQIEEDIQNNPVNVPVNGDTTEAEQSIDQLGEEEANPTVTPNVDDTQAQNDLTNIDNETVQPEVQPVVNENDKSVAQTALSTLGNGIKTTVEASLTKDAELESLTSGQELRGQGVVDIHVGENEAAAEQEKLEQGTESPVHYEPQTGELEAAKAEAEEGVEEGVKFVPENSVQDAANQAGAGQGVTTVEHQEITTTQTTNATVNVDDSQVDVAQANVNNLIQQSGTQINLFMNADNVESIETANSKIEELLAKGGKKVNITINGNMAAFNKNITSATSQLTTLTNKKTNPTIKADNSKLMSAANAAKSKLDTIKSKSITISAHSSGFGSILSEYRQLKSKSITLTTNKVTNITTNRNADGTAHSAGTLMSGGKAFAGGDWGLPKAEKGALINELGSEIVVMPSGQWQILNNGDPTFANLPKGAIIFNHKQSEDLLKNGYVTGSHGKLVGGAFARGTVDEDEDINEEDLDELTGDAFAAGTAKWNGQLSGEAHAGIAKWNPSKAKRSSSSNSSKSSGKSSGKSSKSNKSGKSSGKSNKSSKSSSSSKAKDFLETLDSIEIQINRIDALFQKLDTDIGKTYASFASRASNATSEISKLGDEIKRIDVSLNSKSSKTNYLYKAAEAAKAAGLNSGDEGYTKTGAKGTALSQGWITWIQNSVNTGKYMTIDDVKDEGLWKKIQAYQTWYEKYLKLQQKRQDYVNKMSQLTIQQLQLIQTEWEAVLNNLNAYITENQNRVDLQTEQGYDASVRYYNNQINYNKTRLTDLNKEAAALQAKLNEAVSTGRITKYSEEWYKWQTQIKNIQNEVINTTKEIARLNNEIRQLKWDRFDRAQDKLSDLAEEMEFLNGLIYDNDKFTEEGNITNRGRAAMGLIAMQYDEYIKQAKRYQKEVAALNKDLANDPYNNKLIEQRNTWLKAQQDAIENARQQKEAMADLIEDGIKKQIDYMDELIDKYEDALDAEKAQNKYAEEMAEKQKKVNSIQKQLRALEGDDSEEGQTRRQKLRDDLKEAQKDLKDAQEDQRLSDISDALSEMQEKYEDVLNARLDNIDKLFAESVTAVNQNGASIVSEIKAIGKSVDYNFSELLNGIVTDKSTQDKASDTSSKALVSGTNDTTGLLTNTSAAAVKDRDTGWKKSGNDWYYADEYGNAETGWVKDNNKWYYLDDNGKMTKGWQQVNGKWYHMDGSGAMQSGWQKINNKWYYLNDENDGSMATGWKKVKDKWYYMDSSGAMQTGWQQVNNKWYYLDGSGAMKTGWQKSNNKWYYLDKKTGAMTTGWQKDQNKWYYMDQTGKMTTGWQQVNNKWYYMDGSGAMQTGWKKSNNKWYYLKDDGSMATGWQKVSNKWYYMDNSGAMTTGWQKVNNKWYYMNGSGQMLTGEQKIGQNTYYLGQDGAMRTGKFVVNGITYITDSSGKIKSKVRGKYAKGTANVKQTGLYQVDEQGEEVFINKQGKIYTRLEKGSTVLPHDAAVNLLKGMTNPVEFIANHMDMRPNKNITTTNNTSGNITNYITFNMDGVTNYQEFMREAQRDPNFTKYIQEISIGKLNGNNSLKGNSIRFR